MLLLVVLLPAAAGAVNFLVRSDVARRALLVLAAASHVAFVATFWVERPAAEFAGWVAIDALGLLVLTISSGLFLVASLYGVGYLAHEGPQSRPDFFERGRFFANEPEAVFVGGLLFFLSAMSLAVRSRSAFE